jgi:hypothetical protein
MTRKILIPIDIENPQKRITDFLYPKPTENGLVLTGIKNDKKWDFGMVILTSEINENDILKKIIDSGVKIPSVKILLKTLKEYVIELPNFKIGNILELNNSTDKVEFILKYERITRKK